MSEILLNEFKKMDNILKNDVSTEITTNREYFEGLSIEDREILQKRIKKFLDLCYIKLLEREISGIIYRFELTDMGKKYIRKNGYLWSDISI